MTPSDRKSMFPIESQTSVVSIGNLDFLSDCVPTNSELLSLVIWAPWSQHALTHTSHGKTHLRSFYRKSVFDFLSDLTFYRIWKSWFWRKFLLEIISIGYGITFWPSIVHFHQFWNSRSTSLVRRNNTTPLSRLFARRRREKLRKNNEFWWFLTKNQLLGKRKTSTISPT